MRRIFCIRTNDNGLITRIVTMHLKNPPYSTPIANPRRRKKRDDKMTKSRVCKKRRRRVYYAHASKEQLFR